MTATAAHEEVGAQIPGVPGVSATEETAWHTLLRGLRLMPEFRSGLVVTLLFAVVATVGRIVAPVVTQLTIDRGIQGPTGPRPGLVAVFVSVGFVTLLITAGTGHLASRRLVEASETALAGLRVRAFRRIHDLSALHQAAQHRGVLVSRVTADVDTISHFMEWGAILLLVSTGQLVLATVLMAVYSWQLTVVVLVTFLPLGWLLRWFQRRLGAAYTLVRRRLGELLGIVAETVVAAPLIRAYNIEARTAARTDEAISNHYRASYKAAKLAAVMYSSGEMFAAIAMVGVVGTGVWLGAAGDLTPGRLVAFLFLVTLFVGPVQVATEVFDHLQTAIAGWRRVLDVLDTPADVADPAPALASGDVTAAPVVRAGAIAVRFDGVSFRYSGSADGSLALQDINVRIPPEWHVAIVGATGSGKTTFAKLLVRLMDPTVGDITLNGVSLRTVPFAELRRRVALVPQDGFLFDTTIGENVRFGAPDAGAETVAQAFVRLGLTDWLAALPQGLDTPVGERGEQLSAGERQFVALARAFVADPDLLVLDEATSAIDPAADVRLQNALELAMRGRTVVTIAHRLSTAALADMVLVLDEGRLVEFGPHSDLVRRDGTYRRLHHSWMAHRRRDGDRN